jgi:hypothetical protein
MTQTQDDRPRREGGHLDMSFPGGNDLQANSPSQGRGQAKKRGDCAAHLRVIALPPPPRPRPLEVRITAADGRMPIGRTRPLRLTEPGLARLIEAAERLERVPP